VLLGLTLICSFGQRSIIKGLISGVIGLIFMTVGLDAMMGIPRFTFGYVELQAGVSFLPALIGLFAIPQILEGIIIGVQVIPKYEAKISGLLPRFKDITRLFKTMVLGASVGTGIGAIPGAGGPIAVFLSYDYAKRFSKNRELFGTGLSEGVAAPESANNGVAGGAMIPMLTLGIPGDPITAILLGALMIQGLSTVKIWVRLLQVPARILLPIIAILCIVGSYALHNTFFDTGIMLFFGLLGYFMRKYEFPVVPMLLAIILGPALEEHLRMSLIISQGDPSIFIKHPISKNEDSIVKESLDCHG
jgi:putative tricarboxylic transport membrane protein